jgi:hypothetical protein
LKFLLPHSPVGAWTAALLAPLLSACLSLGPPGLPARGIIGAQIVETRLDSPVAVSYLETGVMPPDSGAAAALPACSDEALARENLADLAERLSYDTAAIFAARCLIGQHGEIDRAFAAAEADIRVATPADRAARLQELASYTLVFVPGWNYLTARDQSGADFRHPREMFTRYGVYNLLTPLDEHGSVEENARTVAETLDRVGAARPVILISASSGGAAVAQALGGEGAGNFPQVAGWLNIGGILKGVPYLDYHDEGMARFGIETMARVRGWDLADLDSMNEASSIERLRRTRVPQNLAMVNFVALTFTGDVTRGRVWFHNRMRRFGPNDGMTPVAGAIAPGGETIVALQKDHFFSYEPEELEIKILAMTRILLAAIAKKRAQPA